MYHDLVNTRRNRRRVSRARSGGPFNHTQPIDQTQSDFISSRRTGSVQRARRPRFKRTVPPIASDAIQAYSAPHRIGRDLSVQCPPSRQLHWRLVPHVVPKQYGRTPFGKRIQSERVGVRGATTACLQRLVPSPLALVAPRSLPYELHATAGCRAAWWIEELPPPPLACEPAPRMCMCTARSSAVATCSPLGTLRAARLHTAACIARAKAKITSPDPRSQAKHLPSSC